MRRSTLNLIIDIVTAIAMLGMVWTGLVIRYTLPTGSGGRGGGRGLTLWGLSRHDWGDVHFWLAVAVGALLVLHVALHWRWVCATVHRVLRPSEKPERMSPAALNLYGAGFVVVLGILIGGLLLVGQATVVSSGGEGEGNRYGRGRGAGRTAAAVTSEVTTPTEEHQGQRRGAAEQGRGNQHIAGSMTLQEVADANGLSVDRLKELLSLPPDTPADGRLGRLKQRYGFEMAEVRRIVAEAAAAKQGPPQTEAP